MHRIAVKEPVLYMTKAPKNDLMREKKPLVACLDSPLNAVRTNFTDSSGEPLNE